MEKYFPTKVYNPGDLVLVDIEFLLKDESLFLMRGEYPTSGELGRLQLFDYLLKNQKGLSSDLPVLILGDYSLSFIWMYDKLINITKVVATDNYYQVLIGDKKAILKRFIFE